MAKVWRIWLDAGHGGSDPGAVSNGWLEKVMNLNAALACKADLESYGVIVGMSRTTDVFLSLDERTNRANAWGADFFVSIHHNAGRGDRGEVIHSIYNGKGLVLANNIKQEFIEFGQTVCNTYNKVGSDNKDYYAVIRNTNMDAVITEGCFIDNATDILQFDTIAEQQEEGRAIARGILKTIGIASKPSTSKPPTPPQPKPTKIDVFYKVYTQGRWLPEVKNLEDYAGIYGQPITAIECRLSNGDIVYRTSNIRQNYYPWVKNNSDYAGDKVSTIDRLQIQGRNVKYQVHLVDGNWLPWVIGSYDFAGIVGRKIDAVYIQII